MAMQSDPTRAADSVVRGIEEGIRSGALAPGQPLAPERELMAEFGVSRTVVREAVRTLSSRGLIEARPRHRPTVRKPGFDAAVEAVEGIVTRLLSEGEGVKNLFDTRILIEAALVRQAALEARKEDIAALRQALEANNAAIPDSGRFYETDVAFHEALYRITGNPVLVAIHKAYTMWLAPQWSRMPRLPERNRAHYAAHAAILTAILSRDPDGAEDALRTHLAAAWKQVRETFGDI